MKQVPASTED